MSLSVRKGAIGAIALLLILAACSNAGTSPSASAVSSAAMSEAATPAVTATPAPTPVAQVPSDQLIFAGKLVICSDIPYPPQEFFDNNGNPVGSDIEIGEAIAGKLGLTAQIENSVFDTIIAAVTTGKCDIIISAQNITPARVKQVDMIPYFTAGQSFVVAKGNPKNINTTDDLCGKSIAAESSTTEIDYLNGTGAYAGKGLSAACVAKGLPKITVSEFQKDSDALAALSSGNVDAYFADSPVAGYYTVQHPDQFQLSGVPPLDTALEGISVPKDKTALRDAVTAALKAMMADGTYLQILSKYALQTGALTAADVVPVTK
jgi:polar amino acid transport system substrate-binding protein